MIKYTQRFIKICTPCPIRFKVDDVIYCTCDFLSVSLPCHHFNHNQKYENLMNYFNHCHFSRSVKWLILRCWVCPWGIKYVFEFTLWKLFIKTVQSIHNKKKIASWWTESFNKNSSILNLSGYYIMETFQVISAYNWTARTDIRHYSIHWTTSYVYTLYTKHFIHIHSCNILGF